MPVLKDLTGQSQPDGRLTVLRRAGEADGVSPGRGAYWICRCVCGEVTGPVAGSMFVRQAVRSCGCLMRERAAELGRAKGVAWTAEMVALLGTVPDEEAARRLGLTPPAAAPPDRGRDAEVRRMREGGMLLREIAQFLGVSKQRVAQILARGGDS